MRLLICAVGRLRPGPEHALVADYASRLERVGRALSLGPLEVAEVDGRKLRGADDEGAALLRLVPSGALICALDERGRQSSSPQFAERLAEWRDAGRPAAAFLIGGADGHSDAVRTAADATLSLGAMVWPHMLARVMLAEQIYRAASILARSPYHRA